MNTSRYRALALLLALCANSAVAGKKKVKGPLNPETHPDLLVEVPGLHVDKAAKPCDNWAWWAAVHAILERQKVQLSQEWFVDHNDGGACLDDDHLLSIDQVASGVTGDYLLDDGRRVHLEAKVGPQPLPVEMMIAAVRQGRPLLMSWKARPYVVEAIGFDEDVYPGGQRSFTPRVLEVINPADGKQEKLPVTDELAGQIGGVIDIVTSEPDAWRQFSPR
jgi:hypothetical protein